MSIDVDKLPPEILRKAVKLRNAQKRVFIALYSLKAASADDVAKVCRCARAYASLRLNELLDMGLLKASKKGQVKMFEVVT